MESGKKSIRIDEIGFGGLKLYQDPNEFCYGIDSVLLADFAAGAEDPKRSQKVVELGAGNGAVSLILSALLPRSNIVAIEVLETACDLMQKSIKTNGLEERIEPVCSDILDMDGEIEGVDMVMTNPPYVKVGSGMTGCNDAKTVARHENTAGLEDFIRIGASMLRERGTMVMIHRPARLAEIFFLARKEGLEPKVMNMVVPRRGKAPNMVLLKMVKGGGTELTVLPELYVYDEQGDHTGRIRDIYRRR